MNLSNHRWQTLAMKLFSKIKAFTLIELMVVVVIGLLLAAIAIPAYKKASSKAKLGEVHTNMGYQLDSWAEKQMTGNNAANVTIGNVGRYLTGVQLQFSTAGSTNKVVGTISGVNSDFNGTTLNYTPSTLTARSISWACTYDGGGNVARIKAITFCTCNANCS